MAANIFLDLQNNAVTAAGSNYSNAITSTGGLTAVDMKDNVGNVISALVTVSNVGSGTTVDLKAQESASSTGPFTDIDGATFPSINAAGGPHLLSFKILKRYVRVHATLGGSSPSATLQVTFLGQRKTTPPNSGGWVNDVYS